MIKTVKKAVLIVGIIIAVLIVARVAVPNDPDLTYLGDVQFTYYKMKVDVSPEAAKAFSESTANTPVYNKIRTYLSSIRMQEKQRQTDMAIQEKDALLAEASAGAIRNSAKIADSSMAEINYDLGMQYRIGKSRNLLKAVAQFKQAAEAGHAAAHYQLGDMYQRGEGVQQNMKEAWEWHQRAANLGIAQSQYELFKAHKNPTSGVYDKVEAMKWLTLHTLQYNSDLFTEELEEYKQTLTHEEQDKARILVSNWEKEYLR